MHCQPGSLLFILQSVITCLSFFKPKSITRKFWSCYQAPGWCRTISICSLLIPISWP